MFFCVLTGEFLAANWIVNPPGRCDAPRSSETLLCPVENSNLTSQVPFLLLSAYFFLTRAIQDVNPSLSRTVSCRRLPVLDSENWTKMMRNSLSTILVSHWDFPVWAWTRKTCACYADWPSNLDWIDCCYVRLWYYLNRRFCGVSSLWVDLTNWKLPFGCSPAFLAFILSGEDSCFSPPEDDLSLSYLP